MKKLLFIGNSHTYFNDMPRMVQELFLSAGEEAHVAMLTQGGMTLDWHIRQEQTRFNLLYGGYDFVVLQQAAHPFDGYQALSDGVAAIRRLPETAGLPDPPKLVLYMTWAEKYHPENQKEMSDAYIRVAEEQGCLLAPVGEIWQKFRREHPQWELYFHDGAHASPLGSFLAAAAIFRQVSNGDVRPDPASPGEACRVLNQLSEQARREIWQAVEQG